MDMMLHTANENSFFQSEALVGQSPERYLLNNSDRASMASRQSSSRAGSRRRNRSGLMNDDDGGTEANELGRAYKNWIETHFSMHPSCLIPVPSPRNPKVCMCGREIGLVTHCLPVGEKKGHDKRLVEWRQDSNVALTATHSYGLVIFKDPPVNCDDEVYLKTRLRSHIQQGRPYIRVSSDDCMKAPQMIKDLLISKWDLEPPRILLGVTGGAGTFDIPPKLDDMIKRGLEKAACSESMWITTGGTNTGVMKYVGAAIAASKSYVPVIGILPYAVINNKDALDTYHKDGKPVAGGLVYYGDPDTKTDSGLGSGTSLDRNHTHFLLVDSGKVGVGGFGSEIGSRSKIEEQVALLYSSGKFGTESPISSVLLAIQGGPGTVQTIYEALCIGTPVVIVDGSGKACNAIAFAYKLPLPGERQDGTEYTEAKLATLVMEEFEIDDRHPNFKKVFTTALKCVREYRDLIHVYEASFSGGNSDESLDVAILNAVLDERLDAKKWQRWRHRTMKKYNMTEVSARLRERDLARALKLEMALMWNRINVVEIEMAKYCVLPSLATLKEKLEYKVLPPGAKTYRSTGNREVTIKAGDKVTAMQIRDQQWLVEVTLKDAKEFCWMDGKSLTKATAKSFADAVTLAQMQMLEYLLIHEKLNFVELFLQGMRTDDIHAFLAVKRQELWIQAADFSANDDSGDQAGLDSEETLAYLKDVKSKRRRLSIKSLHSVTSGSPLRPPRDIFVPKNGGTHYGKHVDASKLDKSDAKVVLNALALPAAAWDDAQSELSVSLLREDDVALDEAAQNLLQQAKAFDDSDTHLPPYIDTYFYTGVVEAQLKCWVNKKKKQLQLGFEVNQSNQQLVKRLEGDKNPSVRQLNEMEKEIRYEDAIWFLKFIFNRGYIVSMHSDSQVAPGKDKLANVDNHVQLIESLAETLHHRWLQRKVEDHWRHGSKYKNEPWAGRKESPYIQLFHKLPPNSKNHNISYARQVLSCVLEKGMWIWRPDNLERLYFLSMDHQTVESGPLHHLERRLPSGVLWRAEIHAAIRNIIGGDFSSDFSTYNALDPRFHLMVFCVCTFRFELANFFWKEQRKDSLINALVCALICYQIVKKRVKNELNPEQISKFHETEEGYKENALAIFQQCVERDSSQTKRLLKAQYAQAGWMTMWGAAYLLQDKTFTSQPIFIETVWTEWLGKLRETNFFKVCLGILMPIPYLMVFTTEPPSGSGLGSFLSSIINAVGISIEDDDLHTVKAPCITFRGSGKTIELTSGTDGATIYYTVTLGREGTDPTGGDGILYRDEANLGGKDTLEPSRILLDKPQIYTIKTCAKVPGSKLRPSSVTTKRVDMGQVNKVDGGVPPFVFGPQDGRHRRNAGYFTTLKHRIHCFYDAPYTTFYTFMLTSLVYTLLYSYAAIVTTTDMHTLLKMEGSESIVTVVVYVWTLTLIVDEIRQAVTSGFREWWSGQGGAWNRVDLLVYSIVVVSALLRIKNEPQDAELGAMPTDNLRWARFLFALGALVVWLRLSRMYALSRMLGPKLVMIFTMMGDVFVFIALLIIVLLGYGVAMHAILEPYRTFDVNSPMTVIFKPMFNAIGETFVQEIQAHTSCLGEDFTQCDDWSAYIVLVLLVAYLVISNILLVNLLIAMMAQTYEKLSENSTAIWSVQNIDLLEEFRELLPLPPPLNLIYNVYDGGRILLARAKASHNNKVGPSRRIKRENCAVDSDTQLTDENHAFLEESTILFEHMQSRQDKNKLMQAALEGLIERRMKHVDRNLETLQYHLRNLAKDFKETARPARSGHHRVHRANTGSSV
eukprot:CAMPEP_0182922766 /NCGR_PEP_ID=MMETSP0105_2-20130417/5009_1 /TAXON_ID=81532 ORGANISM="Acanthoeca-like sp., Strain 10tr" /NCGR_SAMPLE_ID=MMETSP0105_2 /ASSEMBLY_ACC=CAM_ASM_000205 /LENGTH=1794 /DNA_ID=CAMNT_0025060417 /DNA_START=266 /DNA_END=5650 /DNA_ORIENTATION=+